MKQANKRNLISDKPRLPRNARMVKKVAQALVLVGLMLAFMPTAIAPIASAGVPGEEVAVQNTLGMGIFIIGVVLGFILVAAYGMDKFDPTEGTLAPIGVIVTSLLIVIPAFIGIAVYIEGPTVEVAFCDKPENATHPLCVGVDAVTWNVVIEADLDVAGNTYPASPMTVCDTAIGGTTAEWVAADNANADMINMRVTTGYTIDTDLDDTEALWAEPNCIFIETTMVMLLTGPHASGGPMETQHYYARIDHISMTKLPTDNESVQHSTFYQDLSGRWHLGYELQAGGWVEACPEYRGTDLPTSGCAPIPVGQDNGAGDTVGTIGTNGFRIFWIWEDRGPFGHNHLDGATWSLTFSIGSDNDWHTFTFIVTMTESATNNS